MTGPGFVHRFVPATGGSPLTLLLLHGTGGSEADLLGLGREVSPRAALLSPRGRVLEDGRPRFFRRLAPGVFDIHDLTEQTHALARFVGDAAREHGFRADTVAALGYSNGANIAASTLILHPEALAGAVLVRPMVPFVPESPPDLAGKPVLVLAGEQDSMVPMEETERLASVLRRAGADLDLRWAKASHAVSHGEVDAARRWAAAKLPGGLPDRQAP
ncbi:MAG: alpha/beta hydrolase [Nitrososphaerota archaeon]|nr:alpha/beta hydrolase [Nitrososphaerota archaeon]